MSSMIKNYLTDKLIILLSVTAAAQFVILTLVAGLFYPGGYSIVGNYFSDLGAVKVNDHLNPTSSALFMLAIFLTVLLLLPFWFFLVRYFSSNSREKWISIIGSVLGLISSFFLVMVALNPEDTQLGAHVFYAKLFFVCFGIVILIYSVNFYFNKEISSLLVLVGVLIFLSSVIFASGLPSQINIGPFWQKCVVYAYIIWVAIVDYFLWEHVT